MQIEFNTLWVYTGLTNNPKGVESGSLRNVVACFFAPASISIDH